MSQAHEKGEYLVERDHYEPIRKSLEYLLSEKNKEFYLEITADRKFSNKLKAAINEHGNRDIIFSFLKDAVPDITGFVKDQHSHAIIVVEVKKTAIKLDDIYQTKKYAELFNAKYALLISTTEIPEEIKRLSKVVYKLISGGQGYEKIALVQYDPDSRKFTEWFERSPF